MGRLTLNVLLSFAEFEREVTAERIRDKIAASRKKGMWMGGTAASFGEQEQADRQRSIFRLMFRSITLSPAAIRFEVRAREIVQRLVGGYGATAELGDDGIAHTGHDDRAASSQGEDETDACRDTIMIEYPIELRRRGNGIRIVVDSPYIRPEPDPSLVDLIARAHVYLDRLTGPSAMNTTSIADTFDVDRADVGRILPLAFLSPAMLNAILAGQQSPLVTARSLARADLPLLWDGQETVLQ